MPEERLPQYQRSSESSVVDMICWIFADFFWGDGQSAQGWGISASKMHGWGRIWNSRPKLAKDLLNFIRVISETSRSDVLAEIGGFTQRTNIETFKGCWEDDFPLPKGGRC